MCIRDRVYTLTADNTKKVKSVDITPLTSDGTANGYQGDEAKNRMLTLREINFHYAEGDQKPEVPEVNKADLQAKYDELKGKANDGYTEDSWNAFQKALEGAKAVLDKADATQSEVDTALDALVKAEMCIRDRFGGYCICGAFACPCGACPGGTSYGCEGCQGRQERRYRDIPAG